MKVYVERNNLQLEKSDIVKFICNIAHRLGTEIFTGKDSLFAR